MQIYSQRFKNQRTAENVDRSADVSYNAKLNQLPRKVTSPKIKNDYKAMQVNNYVNYMNRQHNRSLNAMNGGKKSVGGRNYRPILTEGKFHQMTKDDRMDSRPSDLLPPNVTTNHWGEMNKLAQEEFEEEKAKQKEKKLKQRMDLQESLDAQIR